MKTLIVVIAHVPLASALKEVALHVFAQAKDILVYDVAADEDPEQLQQKLNADIQEQLSTYQQVIIFSDLIGATPANTGFKIAQALNHQQVSSEFFGGTNVCMLLNAIRYNDLPLQELKTKILEGGQKGLQSIDCSCQ
ncbi:PTS fructose transporter subunit IIA [Pelistega indica]|uniref:PTS fructose transporter subunit IIA n=1 Tax=Pelistega indica TaxID=1414851 RepID=V8FZ83_9BURK|nr:PTS fructose transporter subunit IIA [Pelistega indica]ETD69176.1 PTS fructose transporter subunit IIA [Pelistega indica]